MRNNTFRTVFAVICEIIGGLVFFASLFSVQIFAMLMK